jgi:hypothetical protein
VSIADAISADDTQEIHRITIGNNLILTAGAQTEAWPFAGRFGVRAGERRPHRLRGASRMLASRAGPCVLSEHGAERMGGQ